MTPLRQAMIDQCRLRGLSPRTEETYLYAVDQISRYYNQRPEYCKRNNNHTQKHGCCSDQYGNSLANASGVLTVGSFSNNSVRYL